MSSAYGKVGSGDGAADIIINVVRKEPKNCNDGPTFKGVRVSKPAPSLPPYIPFKGQSETNIDIIGNNGIARSGYGRGGGLGRHPSISHKNTTREHDESSAIESLYKSVGGVNVNISTPKTINQEKTKSIYDDAEDEPASTRNSNGDEDTAGTPSEAPSDDDEVMNDNTSLQDDISLESKESKSEKRSETEDDNCSPHDASCISKVPYFNVDRQQETTSSPGIKMRNANSFKSPQTVLGLPTMSSLAFASANPEMKTGKTNMNPIFTVQAKVLITKKEGSIINTYPRFSNLIHRIFEETSAFLHPFDPTDDAPAISNAQHIPKSEENFSRYCYDSHVNRKGTALFFCFRLQLMQCNFYKLKGNMFPWLMYEKTFINKTILTSGRNCVIGWLRNTSPVLTNRNTVLKELKNNFDTDINFQLIARVIMTSHPNRIVTRALAIECAIADATSLEDDIYSNFIDSKMNNPDNELTKNIHFVPSRANADIDEDTIRALAME